MGAITPPPPTPPASAVQSPPAPQAQPAPTAAQQHVRVYGGLKDQDRIFQNIYGRQDVGIEGALKRVCNRLHYFAYCHFREIGIERKI